jgi:hypothetical protein
MSNCESLHVLFSLLGYISFSIQAKTGTYRFTGIIGPVNKCCIHDSSAFPTFTYFLAVANVLVGKNLLKDGEAWRLTP